MRLGAALFMVEGGFVVNSRTLHCGNDANDELV